MSITGVEAFDTTIHKTNLWLNEIMEELGWDNRQRAYIALRSVIHTLRDRLTVKEATDLGAQLPMLIRGFYYDEWNLSGKPVKFDKNEFLDNIGKPFENEPGFDLEKITRAVLSVIDRHISSDEIEDIKSILPEELRKFWEDD